MDKGKAEDQQSIRRDLAKIEQKVDLLLEKVDKFTKEPGASAAVQEDKPPQPEQEQQPPTPPSPPRPALPQQGATPQQQVVLPQQQVAAPQQHVVLPQQQVAAPQQHVVLPQQQAAAPLQQVVLPQQHHGGKGQKRSKGGAKGAHAEAGGAGKSA
ncbi:glutenin, low molecular weight subunit 1D1-like isoform X2 [Sarcophilus harrisii]|uniref:glutenin, low molecular weight subunit 1D1-like isoform X2 n=1 Tax=Sarcophilus harrisii TaxID=9305 RepID=UPI001301C724|nr:glutenin, low molecular weight subunit 1D1-like isoform X2 [Sarcophilus harrisii]